MYVSPSGRWFIYPAPAVLHAFDLDPQLAQYYADYAPLTVKWLKHLQSIGDIERGTRFDDFLRAILARAGFKVGD